jgi:tetratricopeptide (TPR) repeat protein
VKHILILASTVLIGLTTAHAVSGQTARAGTVVDVIDEMERLAWRAESPVDKLEDAAADVRTALEELDKRPPDRQAALGNLEGAVGDLEAATDDRLIARGNGAWMMERLTQFARSIASQAVQTAWVQGGDEEKVHNAARLLSRGDRLWAAGSYKDAIASFKSALAEAEGA